MERHIDHWRKSLGRLSRLEEPDCRIFVQHVLIAKSHWTEDIGFAAEC